MARRYRQTIRWIPEAAIFRKWGLRNGSGGILAFILRPRSGAAQDLNTDANDLIQNDQLLADLLTQVETCRQCDLYRTRYMPVFGVGPVPANLMIVGEAPSAEDDRQGIPFVGRSRSIA